METETLVVAHLKEGMLEKFMGFMQSDAGMAERSKVANVSKTCLLYTSPSPRDQRGSRMPSSA